MSTTPITTTDSHQCQDKRSVSAPQVCILGIGYVSFYVFFYEYLQLDYVHGTEPLLKFVNTF
jgi:hypothetical protein